MEVTSSLVAWWHGEQMDVAHTWLATALRCTLARACCFRGSHNAVTSRRQRLLWVRGCSSCSLLTEFLE